MPIQSRYIKNKHEVECRVRNYKYTRDHVNHLVDVRDTLKESVSLLMGKGRAFTFKPE